MRKPGQNGKIYFRIISVIIAALFVFTFLTAGTYADDGVINEVRQYLKMYYVDNLSDDVLNKPTVDEIIKDINKTDPYTQYFTQAKYQDFINGINNTFSGIGVTIEIVPEGIKVVTLIDGAPAQAAGIKPGDIIIMADNHILAGLPDDVALGYIKGPEGTSVKLKVKRGIDYIDMNVVRKQINAPTVTEKILDKHIGYIELSSFGENTAVDFGKALKDCEDKKVDSYIFDLRYNPGGYLTAALDIAGYFVGPNVALLTRDRIDGETKNYGIDHGFTIDKPTIFLVNGYSASASEVLSGAVKDYNKAFFIGTKTYGKGCVQTMVPLSNKDVLKFTIQNFYSPKGNTIQKVGIMPDLNITDDVDSMRVAELIFNSPKNLASTKGYVKFKLKGKEIVASMSLLRQPEYWAVSKQLIKTAGATSNILMGNGKGWTQVTKDSLSDPIKILYPGYRELPILKNISLDSEFTVEFNTTISKTSLNSKNIEFIDTVTGERIPATLRLDKGKNVTVTPKSDLTKNKTYYLVVNPTVKKSDNKAIGYGMVNTIQTVNK